MLISRSCSFCQEMNPASERYCHSCRHEAHVARLDCQCRRCLRARHRAATAETPVTLADVIASAIAAIGPRGGQRESPAEGASNPEGVPDMTTTRKNVPDPAPVTREVSRTPASPALAAAIREMDAELVAAHGCDFAYAVLAGGLLVASSNAVHGYVPPVVIDAAAGQPSGGKEAADDE